RILAADPAWLDLGAGPLARLIRMAGSLQGASAISHSAGSGSTPTPPHPPDIAPGVIPFCGSLIISRPGSVVIHATKDFTVKTVQTAADLAVQAGSRLYTDSASSYRALKGYMHAFVHHTQKEYARSDVHEHRAACLFSLLKPYVRVFRGP